MTLEKTQPHSCKVARLLHVHNIPHLAELVPEIFSISPLPQGAADASKCDNSAVFTYADMLEQRFPNLDLAVEQKCGPPPWIIRSAGDEDLSDNVNAGGYESVICHDANQLSYYVATVALSGATEFSRRQLALSGRPISLDAIECFVQPLLDVNVCNHVAQNHSPYFGETVLDRMEAICIELMEEFNFAAIDCEWGVETSLGFVSVTTVMPNDPQAMNVSHTLGFGFATAQSSGSAATSLVIRPAGTSLRLWRGRHLREVSVRRIHLLQVRPAFVEEACQNRPVLTKSCRDFLTQRYDFVNADLLIAGARAAGRALVAANLMSAWRRFLAFNPDEQQKISVVMVNEGSAEEHAGIMFRQQKVTCVKVTGSRMPGTVDSVIFDRGACILGDLAMVQSAEYEMRKELVLPGGCSVVFGRNVLDSYGQVGQKYVDILEALQNLAIGEYEKERLLARTEQPTSGIWIQWNSGEVQSPALLSAIWHSKAKAAVTHSSLTEFCQSYRHAVQTACSMLEPEVSKQKKMSPGARALMASGDVRIIMALLQCKSASDWVSPRTIRSLVNLASSQLASGCPDNALEVLRVVDLVAKECASLPMYTLEDKSSYVSAIARILQSGLSIETLKELRSLELPTASLVSLARELSNDDMLLMSAHQFSCALSAFRGSVTSVVSVSSLSKQLNDTCGKFLNQLLGCGLYNVAEQIKGSVIELYDSSLKSLLSCAVDEETDYLRYLDLMRDWISYLTMGAQSGRDCLVLECFKSWLKEWAQESPTESFQIYDRNWKVEFDIIAGSQGTCERYENPHVVHNLLHQYSLSGLQLTASQLPVRIQELQQFCSTFSSRSTKVLRFERELLEIQIPMGTHKASYVFTPLQIAVEWTEPPDCSNGEIARIISFESFLDKLRLWMFPQLVYWREQVVGTWTLSIRLKTQESDPLSYELLKRFVVATRFMFDASYDFSYVPNRAVEGFAERFVGNCWELIIGQMIAHRALVCDTTQYVALHALPMSSALASISCSRVIRSVLKRCLRRGFDYSRNLIDRYSRWLCGVSVNERMWPVRYEMLRQISFFLAVQWPDSAFSYLAGRRLFSIGDDLVAASLFKRLDMTERLVLASKTGCRSLTGIQLLIVRYVPEIAVEQIGARQLAMQLVGTGCAFRRAKDFLISRFAHVLDKDLLKILVRNRDSVPWGQTEESEKAIQRQLPRNAFVCRFELDRGIDWALLDSKTQS